MADGLLKHLVKQAAAMPRLPFMGPEGPQERLPGMIEWIPRGDIVRMGKLLREGKTPDEIARLEQRRGLLSSAGYPGAIGAGLGVGGSRLVGGEAAFAPLQNLKAKGITPETLRGLSKVPNITKLLPLVGLTLGSTWGLGRWLGERDLRRRKALEVTKGLLTEDILRQQSLRPVLYGLNSDTAKYLPPLVVTPGNTGV